MIWAGSDDGLVHITRDGGMHWVDVSPPAPPYGRIENIDASPFKPGSAFLAVDRHFMGDRTAYAFATDDYGATWRSIARGLPSRANTCTSCAKTRTIRISYMRASNKGFGSRSIAARTGGACKVICR